MAVKQTGQKVYRTMQGKPVDMDLLRKRYELTPAVGNAKVNARGDELGAGGKIIRKREEVLADYYRDHPKAVPDVKIAEATQPKTKKAEVKVEVKAEEPKTEAKKENEWVEDADGNFVKK
ncbi:uncharacterized protein METZ01_LOCUS279687 [marine metagenome]|uniref:Uncharacterized protein n=1 Tax=marine metagenome TaxID=408172 RepID=A0A382KTH6_9ZZZZ|tara:strand:- start:6647 stop:7006 length:360 start_codon:yes stop_codon:yes gene_type:complete